MIADHKGGLFTTNRNIPEQAYRKIRQQLAPDYRFLMDLLRLTGYRVGDLLATRNWQWSGAEMVLHEAKTGRKRAVKLTPEIMAALRGYRRMRGDENFPPFAYAFQARRRSTGTRRRLHRSTLYRAFAEATRRAGQDGHGYTLHSLRKNYALDLLRRTQSVEAVQKDLGHKYISTTLLYLMGAVSSKQISD